MGAMATTKMIMEFEQRFPFSHIMDAFSIVYSQFWLAKVINSKLQFYLGILKDAFRQPKEIQIAPKKWKWTRELLQPIAFKQYLECFQH